MPGPAITRKKGLVVKISRPQQPRYDKGGARVAEQGHELGTKKFCSTGEPPGKLPLNTPVD